MDLIKKQCNFRNNVVLKKAFSLNYDIEKLNSFFIFKKF